MAIVTRTVTDCAASAATSYAFTDLTGVYKVEVIFHRVGLSSSDTIIVRTSTNNGSSYDSGATDYKAHTLDDVSDAKTDANAISLAFSAGTLHGGALHLMGFNLAVRTLATSLFTRPGTNITSIMKQTYRDEAVACDAFRIETTGGSATMNSGKIEVITYALSDEVSQTVIDCASASATSQDITGLSGAKFVEISGHALTFASGTPGMQLLLSSDNGSSFHTGSADYRNTSWSSAAQGNATAAYMELTQSAQTAPLSFQAKISGLKAAVETIVSQVSSNNGTGVEMRAGQSRHLTEAAQNALRVQSDGAAWAGGHIIITAYTS